MDSTRKITIIGLLCAFALAVYALTPKIALVPAVPFLYYDPKDIVIVMGGFLLGPLSALIITVIVALVEMVTFSETGYIGLIMNILSSTAFAVTASFIYSKKRGTPSLILSLATGALCMTAVMMMYNYLISPLYMNIDRNDEVFINALLVGFLPFNLIKSSLNAVLAVLIYIPLRTALGRANLVPLPPEE